jgi:hypothetical protein
MQGGMPRIETWKTVGAIVWMDEIERELKMLRKAKSAGEAALRLKRIREAVDLIEAHQADMRARLPSLSI